MQLAGYLRRHGIICINQQVTTRRNGRGWEWPPGQIKRVVREVPAFQNFRQSPVVVQFDPIRPVVAGGIGVRATVAGHEFVDDHVGGNRTRRQQPNQNMSLVHKILLIPGSVESRAGDSRGRDERSGRGCCRG